MLWTITFLSVNDPEISSIQTQEAERGLFLKTNEERSNKLEWNECLRELAIERSKDMVNRDYFSHDDPETGNNETWDKIVSSCGIYVVAGENLVKNHKDYKQAHRALMGSELHRKNIVNERFTDMGVGCYENVCTELFSNFNLFNFIK